MGITKLEVLRHYFFILPDILSLKIDLATIKLSIVENTCHRVY